MGCNTTSDADDDDVMGHHWDAIPATQFASYCNAWSYGTRDEIALCYATLVRNTRCRHTRRCLSVTGAVVLVTQGLAVEQRYNGRLNSNLCVCLFVFPRDKSKRSTLGSSNLVHKNIHIFE